MASVLIETKKVNALQPVSVTCSLPGKKCAVFESKIVTYVCKIGENI